MSEPSKEKDQTLLERINEKINETERYMQEFSLIGIPEIEEYRKNLQLKAACERYFEKIIEPVISIAFLVIRLEKLTIPESEEHAFIILAKNKIISESLATKLKDAKDMRNRIIHNYITIDDSIVYDAITKELLQDSGEFLNVIKQFLI